MSLSVTVRLPVVFGSNHGKHVGRAAPYGTPAEEVCGRGGPLKEGCQKRKPLVEGQLREKRSSREQTRIMRTGSQ